MYYDRKVKYLDYYERGERVRGGGHAKLEARDGRLRLELAVTGMHATDSYVRDVLICAEGRENAVGKIEISEGRGNYRQQWARLEDIGGTGICYEELCGIRIPLGAGREISCHWPAVSRPAGKETVFQNAEMRAAESDKEENSVHDADKRQAEEVWNNKGRYAPVTAEKETVLRKGNNADTDGRSGSDSGVEHNAGKDGAAGEEQREPFSSRRGKEDEEGSAGHMRGRRGGRRREAYVRGPGETAESGAAGSTAEREQMSSDGEPGSMKQEQWSGVREQRAAKQEQGDSVREQRAVRQEQRDSGGEQGRVRQEHKTVKLLENKWSQLWAIYPHIRPFNDEREYISISPSDFVLFPEASYKRSNNSFLLHGFYNYRHLLLARVERKGEVVYYIGVPGTFFEKEKQVAVMFGFESFECAEEPAQAGDFGYYMMRTAL